MIITYILLAMCIISMILLELSPRLYFEKSSEVKNLAQPVSELERAYKTRGTLQYAIMRITTATLIATLGIVSAIQTKMGVLAFAIMAFVLFMTADDLIAVSHLKGMNKLLLKKLGFIAKVFSQIFFIFSLSTIIDNGEVTLATAILGFIVGAIVNKLINKRPFEMRAYVTLANSLTFSNLGLAIIALLYSTSAFTLLALIGFSVVLCGVTLYIVNCKAEWCYYATSIAHSLGYILIALAYAYTF